MLKYPIIIVLGAMLASPAVAVGSPADTVSLEAWSAQVEKSLGEQLRYPVSRQGDYDQGMVEVTFRCSDAGRPDKVILGKSSGSRQLDRAAVRAVERIASLHPLAKGVNHDQVYKARLMFGVQYAGDSGKAWQRRLAAMQQGAIDNNGWLKRRNDGATGSAIMLVPATAR